MVLKSAAQVFEEQRREKRTPFSVEMFPPKGQLTLDAAREVVEGLRAASPDFISVTCSAGGSGNGSGGQTVTIAELIQDEAAIPAVAHFTCVSATRDSVNQAISDLRAACVRTVLALRGDLVEGQEPADFPYACELIPLLKDAGFCVGAAAYPEGHIDCLDPRENLRHLKAKQEAGADFFITQLFFNNDDFYRFRDDAAAVGVTAPITCGIMPFLGKSQIQRMVFLCGSSLPAPIIKLLAKYEDDPASLRQAGIEYACNQLVDLGRQGVDGLHVYAMNQPDIAHAAAGAIAAAGLR
ncbi:methylenetetrahydrofolate reductase [Adlercreutzia sp. R25]|uniref:methylenetetrahydrofolate reductase n=1 Tax=Adlercreutzia shanghongiae TaxID=3111773 RepID=UPI002DBB0B2C|nr:methylenetetrahydrofolate reductase [Adlercreutzia sp. R25]MEC4273011.1 methylenetetrahydrofolate reductase [Adlercreutzia sp. R25]